MTQSRRAKPQGLLCKTCCVYYTVYLPDVKGLFQFPGKNHPKMQMPRP